MASEPPRPSYFQNIYGLTLESNRLLPALRVASSDSVADLRVSFREGMPPKDKDSFGDEAVNLYTSPYTGDTGLPLLTLSGSRGDKKFRLRYENETEFTTEIASGCKRVEVSWSGESTFEDAVTYFYGPVLGFILRFFGKICLHASVVQVGTEAIAIVGPAGAGKSTTALGFAQLGMRVLSDDIAVLSERHGTVVVEEGYGRVCVTPDTVTALMGQPDALPQIAPHWEKRSFDLQHQDSRTAAQPLPLAAIYVLGTAQEKMASALRVQALNLNDCLIQLLGNSYVSYLLSKEQKAEELSALCRIIGLVPVRMVRAAVGIARLRELCETIICDLARLPSGHSVSS